MKDAIDFYRQIESVKGRLPPVQDWNPCYSGDMDCVIKRDGSWWIDGDPVKNNRLVRLFSTVLKREGNEYFLVTPVEKWRIQVEDLPFMVVELTVSNPGTKSQTLEIRTNVDDRAVIGPEHKIETSTITGVADNQPIPYAEVRLNLMARFNRNTYLELSDLLEPLPGSNQYRLTSAGETFLLKFN